MKANHSAVLLLQCPERKGVVAAIANFLYQNDGNILQTDEYSDPELDLFMMRVEWEVTGFRFPVEQFAQHFGPLAKEFSMQWTVHLTSYRPRAAIMVSRSGHCLADLLYRHHIGELPCEIPVVISNHEDQRELAEFYKIPFHQVHVAIDAKDQAAREVLALLEAQRIELVVLARYMQILSQEFISRYPNRIINIHHSFLPAFVGAKPYHRSFERGVKLIGATSHYVTEVLDEGPIIEQQVARVDHSMTAADVTAIGQDTECLALARAVRWHTENRVLLDGRRTVVFR